MQRKIKIIDPIHLTNPGTGLHETGPNSVLGFGDFLAKIYCHPMWNDSWKHGLAQRSISRAYKEAVDGGATAFIIADEDWQFLVEAAKNPRTAILIAGAGMQIVPGIGYLPNMAAQILPMQLAVIEAEEI